MKKTGVRFWIKVIVFGTGILLPLGVLGAEEFEIHVHGYISQGFMFSNHNNYLANTKNGTFQFNELGLNVSTEPSDKLRVGIQLAALDLGDLGNDRITIDWAYADYRWQDWLGLRVGKVKLPTGFYNKARDVDMLRTSILLPQSIYVETFRDTLVAMKGISGYGEIPLHAFGNLSYEILLGSMNIDREGPSTKGVEAPGFFKVDKYNVKKALLYGAAWETPLKGLRLGFSNLHIDFEYTGFITKDLIMPVPYPPYSITLPIKGLAFTGVTPDFLRTVFSLEYTWKDLILAAEYLLQDQNNIIHIPGLPSMERLLKIDGYYASATYRINDWFETGVYYSAFYKDRHDRKGTKTPYNPPFNVFQKDACLSLRFDPSDNWTLKLEGHLMDGTGLCFLQDNLNENGVPEYKKDWYLLAAKMTFSF